MSSDAVRFWVQRGKSESEPLLAVTPGTSSNTRGVEWRREKIQTWTRARLHHHGARFDHYVDIGCGFGDFTVALGRRAGKITACDISPEFVEQTRRRLADAGRTDARVVESDARSFIDYARASVVYLGGVLTYLDRDGVLEVLRHVRERLTPDAIVCQRDWCAVGFGRERQHTQPWFSVHRRPTTYISLFDEAGFELVEQTPSIVMYADLATRAALHDSSAARPAAWLARQAARAGLWTWTRCSVTSLYRPR